MAIRCPIRIGLVGFCIRHSTGLVSVKQNALAVVAALIWQENVKTKVSKGENMFQNKKLYKITYQLMATYTTIIEAKNEGQALKKFKKEVKWSGVRPSIISFEEYRVE